jgi:hypothetical protein
MPGLRATVLEVSGVAEPRRRKPPERAVTRGVSVRFRRSGHPVEGTVEVVEYDRDRAFGVLTHEGPVEIRGRATFEPIATHRTRLTITADMQGMDDSMKSRINSNVEQSLRTINDLIEAEL